MPPRAWLFRIQDILEAIESIQSYTEDMEFATFENDRRTVDAVVRNLIIIGEAATRVPDESAQRFPEIPWAEMRAMRNLIVHEYFGVSDRIIWDTAKNNLPPLVAPLRTILESTRNAHNL